MKHPLNDITAAELKLKLDDGQDVNILDVREHLEYATYNIGGVNLPLGVLVKQIEDLNYNPEDEIIVVCQRGLRSETARQLMLTAGFINVKNLSGGLIAYHRIT